MKIDTEFAFQSSIIEQSRKTQTNSRHRGARSIIREFALNTSTHALPAIARSENRINRLFWSASFIIFTGVMSYFISESIINYFQYPAQTSVSVVVDRSQLFPAVTVCNSQRVRWDTVFKELYNYSTPLSKWNITQETILSGDYLAFLYKFLIDQANKLDPIEQYFFPLEIMLMSCVYNQKECSAGDFISFMSPTHGSCYTFNAKRTDPNQKIFKINEKGGSGILQLRFYSHRHLYVPILGNDISAGMVVTVHHNRELPMVDESGIYLSAGKRHKISFKKRSTYFLPSPYTDCTTEIPPTMKAMFSKYEDADYEYSQEVCNIFCKQAFIYDECGCVDPDQWLARAILLPGTNELIEANICYPGNACMGNASIRLSEDDDLWKKYCSNCKQACTVIDFTLTTSAANAPTYQTLSSAKSFVEQSGVPLPTNWSTDWIEEVKENYVAVDIICRSVIVENFTQSPSYGPVDLLSNVGGQTGLWIGISFLSIMEFVEMLFRLIGHGISSRLNFYR